MSDVGTIKPGNILKSIKLKSVLFFLGGGGILFFSLSNPSMYIPFAILLNDAAYKLHDYLKIICLEKKKGAMKYKNWKVSSICLKQLQNTTNWIGP